MTCSLALDDASLENGCLQVVPGSHLEPTLRPHRPSAWRTSPELRDEAHTLTVELSERDLVVALPVRRGSIPPKTGTWKRASNVTAVLASAPRSVMPNRATEALAAGKPRLV